MCCYVCMAIESHRAHEPSEPGIQTAAARLIERSRKAATMLGATLCAGALLFAATPAVAAAQSVPLEPASPMSLSFASETARLVGSDALVLVKCTGSRNGICNGTVTLSAGGQKHKVPFSVVGGSSQSLVVPVGSSEDLGSTSGLAVARTSQPSGGYRRSSEVLHFQ
jgi:hypothetical protein